MRKRLTQDQRWQVYDKCEGNCAYCGCEMPFKDMQVDHVVPLHLDGADDLENMLPACRSCNHYKSTMTLEKFRETLLKTPDVLRRDSATFRISDRFGLVSCNESPIKFYFEILREDD